MLDQSFSAENFRRILDLSNRKGEHLEKKLSMTRALDINQKIKDCNAEIRKNRKEADRNKLKELFEEKKELKKEKEKVLQSILKEVSEKITDRSFRIKLKEIKVTIEKPIYTTPNTPEHFFALKQIQTNILRLFGVKQANRTAIIEQVISLLGDKFPKYIIRTDIENFYESILHEPLIKKIYKDNLLTPLSRKILTGILNSYKKISGKDKGIPRGIGVSAYLAELFMRDIDSHIQDIPGVTYYARYVDDIIIIFTPSKNDENRMYFQEVEKIIEMDHKLLLNKAKTKKLDLRNNNKNCCIDYLGYNINHNAGKIETELTKKKIKKYCKRIESTFDHYVYYSKSNEKSARKILVKRIRFLTGNTRLTNNKKNILVGVYYSNKMLTKLNQLVGIDKFLSSLIEKRINSPHLKVRLKKYSFKTGFETRRFSPFKTDELSEIMQVWKKNNS